MLLIRQRAVVLNKLSGQRRLFMSLSDLVSAKKQYSEQKVFPYTKEQIYNVVSDVNKYKEFVPMCVGSQVFELTRKQKQRDPRIETVEAELVVGYPPFRERYTSVVTFEDSRVIARAAPNGGMFKHMETIWQFLPARASIIPGYKGNSNSTGTLVKFSINFEFSSVLHAQAANLAFEKMANSTLTAYLKRCKGLYGRP